MKEIITPILPLCWNIIFVCSCTIAILVYCNKKADTKSKRLRNSILILSITAVLLIIVSILLKIEIGIQIIFEALCWCIILYHVYKMKKLKNIIIQVNKTQILIIAITLVFGLGCLVLLGTANSQYISPSNEYGYIENFYFNADTHRAIEDGVTINFQHNIHPGYRFILMPIVFPIILLSQFANFFNINQYMLELVCGYLLSVIQILLNVASVLIFYKILKQQKINDKICFFGAILFSICFSSLWVSILPETYAITLFTLLMCIYLQRNENKLWLFFGIASISTNLIVAVPIGIILLTEIIKNKKIILKKIKINKIMIIVLAISIPIMLLVIKSKDIVSYMFIWRDVNTGIFSRIYESFNYLIVTWIWGPKMMNNFPYFVQIGTPTIYTCILMIPVLIFAVIGYCKNRKCLLPNICFLLLITGYGLHAIFGYGRQNGIIYTPLYSWAFLFLILCGGNVLYEKYNKRVIEILLICMILTTFVMNINWLLKLRKDLKNIKFSVTQNLPMIRNFTLELENGTILEFEIKYNNIMLKPNKKVIIEKTNGYTYTQEKNMITGFLTDSSWFQIYTDGNKLMINRSGNIEEIENTTFYIFGMGLREKYIYKDYKLLKYSNQEIIVDNLILEKIDYENYVLYAKDKANNKIVIYENENGVYLKINEEIRALDESTGINIPDFSNELNGNILKILFNEVMVNITPEGPKPNFIAYQNTWYRDAAIVAMFLNKTRKS